MSIASENWVTRHRITVDEYYRMAEAGVLKPEARVELIEGEVIDMAPIGSPHAGIVDRLNRLLQRAVGDAAIVGVQRPIRLGRDSEPEPDLVLLRPRDDFYARSHPTEADVLLVVEVAEASLRYDRHVKMALYARHGIPEAWLVDVQNRRVHFFAAPRDGEYGEARETGRPGETPIAALAGTSVDLAGIF